ncbi:DUF6268 family outer membrane beta-barrel protein [Verrucomicrobiaceae bacterium 227]
MNNSTPILLAASLLGVSSVLAQKEADVFVQTPTHVDQRPTGLGRLLEIPDFKFGSSSGEANGPGIPVGQLSYSHHFSSDFDTLGGDLSSDEFSFITPLASIRFGDTYVIPLLTYRWNEFSTSTPNLLTEDTLHQIRMPIAILHEPADRWLVGGMVMPAFAGDLSNSDNFSISAAIGAGYQYSDDLTIFGGAYYFNGYDESYAIGGLGFMWQATDKLSAYLLGPIAGLSYTVNDRWNLSLTAKYDSPIWNVEADALGPERDISITSFQLGLKSEHKLGKNVWGYATVGYSFLREMEIEDLDSNALQTDDIDSGLFLETGLTLRF